MFKLFPIFKIKFRYNPSEDEIKHTAGKIAIRFINFEQEAMIDVGMLNTTHQDIIITLVFEKNVTPCWYVMDH